MSEFNTSFGRAILLRTVNTETLDGTVIATAIAYVPCIHYLISCEIYYRKRYPASYKEFNPWIVAYVKNEDIIAINVYIKGIELSFNLPKY